MLRRFINLFQYRVERFLQGGARNHLFFVAVVIGLISLVSGFLVREFDPKVGSLPEAIWWAFLRLTDPGYLGDDQGTGRRVVSTAVTVAGYVLFMGALVAILTQWLNQNMRRLESGLTPISRNGHILLLGWTERTPEVVKEILGAGTRLDRFLKFWKSRGVHVVILAPQVSNQLTVELKEELGQYWDPSKITFRTGTPLKLEDLERVDFMHAAAIILPTSGQSSHEREIADASTIKILLTIAEYARESGDPVPQIVTEIVDTRRTLVAERACSNVEVVEGESIVCRLLVQNIRNPGLSYVYQEFLSNEIGNGLFVREVGEDFGLWSEVATGFDRAIPLGLIRGKKQERIVFSPGAHFKMKASDRLILAARTYDETTPAKPGRTVLPTYTGDLAPLTRGHSPRKVLLMGWSKKVAPLCRELATYTDEQFTVDVVSVVPKEDREKALSGTGGSNLQVNQIALDYTVPEDLAEISLDEYDNVVFLAGDWVGTIEESDARTLLGHLLVREALKKESRSPSVLVELVDPDNEALFEKWGSEFLTSPSIISHMLGNVALRPDLNRVFEELFDSQDAEFRFCSSTILGVDSIVFQDAVQAFRTQGSVLLGWIQKNEGFRPEVVINPPADSRTPCTEAIEFILVTQDLNTGRA